MSLYLVKITDYGSLHDVDFSVILLLTVSDEKKILSVFCD